MRPLFTRVPVRPPQRPTSAAECLRLVAGVVDALQHRRHGAGGLAGDRRLRAVAAGPDVAASDRHRLAGEPNEPLDVVGLGILRIAEDDHIPAPRRGEVVGKLIDEDPVAVEGGIAGIVLRALRRVVEELHHQTAVGAAGCRHEFPCQPGAVLLQLAVRGFQRFQAAAGLFPFRGAGRGACHHGPLLGHFRFEPGQFGAERLRLVVLLGATAHPVVAATRRTLQILVTSHQRWGHRSGGDHEGLRLEGSEEECQREGDDDRLDRLATEGQRADDHVAGPGGGGPAC